MFRICVLIFACFYNYDAEAFGLGGCDINDVCSDPNSFCKGTAYKNCACNKGYYEKHEPKTYEGTCVKIPANSTFDCNKFVFPCGKKEGNFGNNEDRKCFCLPEERTLPIWYHCTPKSGGRACSDPNAFCDGSGISDASCKCNAGYYQVSHTQIDEEMRCDPLPKNAVYYNCSSSEGTVCYTTSGSLNFETSDNKCFCTPE